MYNIDSKMQRRNVAYNQVKELSRRLGVPLTTKWAKGSKAFWNAEIARLQAVESQPVEPQPVEPGPVRTRRRVVKRRRKPTTVEPTTVEPATVDPTTDPVRVQAYTEAGWQIYNDPNVLATLTDEQILEAIVKLGDAIYNERKALPTYQTSEYQILKPEVVPVPKVRKAVRKEMPVSTTSRNIFHMLYNKKKEALPTYQTSEYQILKPEIVPVPKVRTAVRKEALPTYQTSEYQILKPEVVPVPKVRTAVRKEMPAMEQNPSNEDLFEMYSAKLNTVNKKNKRLTDVIKTGEKITYEEAFILEKHLRAEIKKFGPKAVSRLSKLVLDDDAGRRMDANTVLRMVFRLFMEEARKVAEK